jgi:hypothetical protein
MSAWYEIIVRGPEDALRGFIAGREASLGGTDAAIFGHDLDLEGSRFSQRVKDLFAAGSHHLVFAPPRLAEDLLAALKKGGEAAGLAVESLLEVTGARLPFAAEAFSREVAGTIREELLSGLPPGVRGEGVEESEEVDPDARGPELYTPEHAYVYRANGAFTGPLEGVVEMQRRARHLPFVKVKPLELETRPVEQPGETGA